VEDNGCPFCNYGSDRIVFQHGLVAALRDAYPVSPGHTLLVTRRHVPTWFDATDEERHQLLEAIGRVKAAIETEHNPHGYNVGFNAGAAAGQAVFHLHVHVIPRYHGDVADPRGGVRHVIATKANYLQAVGQQHKLLGTAPHDRELIRGGDDDPLLSHLKAHLDAAISVDIAVAFVMHTGVRSLIEYLRDVLNRGGRVRLVTGDYMGVTQPEALRALLDLHGDVQLRVIETGSTSFHPKAYIVSTSVNTGVAFIGSSNLSGSALEGGIEWNYRIVSSERGFAEVLTAFEELFRDPRTRVLTSEWINGYASRRQPLPAPEVVFNEPPPSVPTPHVVQREALRALDETRRAGNAAGLVVLATGLGKTWLSAFDSNKAEFKRILFVAHREEILDQAMRTFRAIRPGAAFGYYTGKDKAPAADVLFASIQTIGRQYHLGRFSPREFDYVIVDEFHHACAATYRRLIGYLEPKFLLGLTATPERTDGGDLLSLCGDNLVLRRDVADGIRRELLCPFTYFGVPDSVDYENIPWRSGRFDEEALTTSVATTARAQNALEQVRLRGGDRAIAFCVSQRHADFMAAYFNSAGVRSVAVHAGPTTAPRAHSLEQLQRGELNVVFAVDMFNEGVDIPDVDTVLMLRPTESRVLWLQQFGRGLRHRFGKTLKVIDYIGNHRVFLTKTRALLDLGDSNRDVAYALDRYEAGSLELPPGCAVTYDLEAIQILRALVQPRAAAEALTAFYENFRDRVGVRPSATEAYAEGYNPITARQHHGSWLGFVRDMGDFSPEQEEAWSVLGDFLNQLEVTSMTKSYKMILLLAMLGQDAFPGQIHIDELAERFAALARRYAAVRTEVGEDLDDSVKLRRMLERNPVDAWVGGRGTADVQYFSYDGQHFLTTSNIQVPAHLKEVAQDLVREIAEWRLTGYLRRSLIAQTANRIVCSVSHSSGRPILFLPNRSKAPGIPEGWQDVVINGEMHQAKFVKIAVNVVTRPASEENVLPAILKGWFGEQAGMAGRTDTVAFTRSGDTFVLAPAQGEEPKGLEVWQRYMRADAVNALGFEFRGQEAQSGIFERPGLILLFVTLDKGNLPEAHRYEDQFLSATEFRWQSQNRTTQASRVGTDLRDHRARGIAVHLFVRRQPKIRGRAEPFVYCGEVSYERWEDEKPITVWWTLAEAVPQSLWNELKVPSASSGK
jgi:superfamily II DNA or RNA helicase/HKD family nuclease/diadenosine tetraphosphate (Ap4A) HIT family hydrolase